MTAEEIFAGESENIEFKSEIPAKSEKYMKTVVAFANGKGGKLVFGVENGTWTVTGFSKEEVFQKMDAITNAIFDSCEPKITPNIAVQEIDGKAIIVVEIIPGMQRPYYIKSQGIMEGTYIRVAGTTRHAERYRVQELIMEGTNRSFDQMEREQTVSEEEIAAFCEKMYQHALKLAETDTAREQIQKVSKNQLLSWKLLVERDGAYHPTNGYLLLNFRKFELHANMVLLLSPHQQQEWHVDEAELDYSFLIFREDFMRTFLADKFFVYRLLYYYQTDTPPYLFTSPESMAEYIRLLGIIKQELLHPVADTYNLIVSVLYYLLVIINRAYAATYHLPIDVPKNNYAFQFKDLLEKNIRTKQRVQEYADMLRVSRITLNSSVMSQFGVSANHLLKQRLLEELKNELLFANRNVNQLAEEFHFSDPSHLMRFFKRETGKTFTQYLRDYQNGIYE